MPQISKIGHMPVEPRPIFVWVKGMGPASGREVVL